MGWLKVVWNLPWNLKGPFLGVVAVVIALAVTLTVVIATGGDDGTAGSEVVQAPSPTAIPEASPTAPSPKPTPPTFTAAEVVTLVVKALERGELQNGMLTFPYAGLWVVHASSCTATWEKGHWWVHCDEAQVGCPAGEVCRWIDVNVCLWESPLEVDTCL